MIYYISENKVVNPNIQWIPVVTDESVLPELNKDAIGWDTETTGLVPFYSRPIMDIFGDEDNSVVIDLLTVPESTVRFIHNYYSDRLWIAHNAKFDYKMMSYHYKDIAIPSVHCTMVVSQIIYNGYKVSHSLENLVRNYFGVQLDKDVRVSFVNWDVTQPFSYREIQYAADDVKWLIPLKNKQYEYVNKWGYQPLVDLENKFLPLLSQMELGGFRFDTDKWLSLSESNNEQLKTIEQEIVTELIRLSKSRPRLRNYLVGRIKGEDSTINLKSKDELANILEELEELGNFEVRKDLQEFIDNKITKKETARIKKVTVKTKQGNYVVGSLFDVPISEPELKNSEAIKLGKVEIQDYLRNEANINSPIRKLLDLVLQHRAKAKELSTYGSKFAEQVNKVTGRIHTEYRQTATATGRLSSSKYKVDGKVREGYNAQNIPKTEAMRNCFMADDGYMIATIDYSGQETVLAASQSKDPMLMASVNEGTDLHSYLATGTFRIVYNDPELIVTEKHNKPLRTAHKPILFGVFYGAQASRVSQVLNIPKSIATQVYNNIRKLLPDFFTYQDSVQKFALSNMYIHDHSKYKRRRWFTKDDPKHRIEKQASNFGMQSSGASMMKEALVTIEEFLQTIRHEYPLARIIGTVHDEAIIQLPADRKDYAERCKEIMIEVGNSFVEGVSLKASLAWEPYWTK